MTNASQINPYTKVIKELSHDYNVAEHYIEQLLDQGMQQEGMLVNSARREKILDIWYRDCADALLEQIQDYGLSA